jgi:hypothetical protein
MGWGSDGRGHGRGHKGRCRDRCRDGDCSGDDERSQAARGVVPTQRRVLQERVDVRARRGVDGRGESHQRLQVGRARGAVGVVGEAEGLLVQAPHRLAQSLHGVARVRHAAKGHDVQNDAQAVYLNAQQPRQVIMLA